MRNGILDTISSFIVTEEDDQQLKPDAVTEAEEFFASLIRARFAKPTTDWEADNIETTVETAIEEGYYDDKNGFYFCIHWSNVK